MSKTLYFLLFGLALAGSFFSGSHFATSSCNQRYAKAQIVADLNDLIFFQALASRDPSELNSIIDQYVLASTESIASKLENWESFKEEFHDDVISDHNDFRTIDDVRLFFEGVVDMSGPRNSATNEHAH